jgi:hypothetical protein
MKMERNVWPNNRSKKEKKTIYNKETANTKKQKRKIQINKDTNSHDMHIRHFATPTLKQLLFLFQQE